MHLESRGNRLAAAALHALYRPRQAQALWRRLAYDYGVDASGDQRERAKAALMGKLELPRLRVRDPCRSEAA